MLWAGNCISYVKGAGSVDKKRKCLIGWLLDKGQRKQHYREFFQSVSVVKSVIYVADWMTYEEAKGKYGTSELKERVDAGTILARRCPKDQKFFEFLECVECVALLIFVYVCCHFEKYCFI
jgi:hypothetical protein